MSSTLLIRVPSTSSSQLVRSNIRQTVLENLDSADAYPHSFGYHDPSNGDDE